MASTTKLTSYINRLESYIPKQELINPKISKATIAWQIDHSLKVVNNVILALQSSDPNAFKNNMTFIGKFLLTLGIFPRGKAKAPKYVIPPEIITKENLVAQAEAAKQHIESIADLPDNAYFRHPMFGHINKKRVTRFLEVHTNHHLKIIRDILK